MASIQTLGGRSGKRLMRFDPDQIRIVIIDEAHHAPAESYRRVLQHFSILPPDSFLEEGRPSVKQTNALLRWNRARLQAWDDQIRAAGQPPTLLLGVTATPKRGDNIGLEAVFSKIAFERNMREMIEAGWLCRLRGIRVKSETDLDSVSTRAGDFAQDELAEAVNQVDRNKLAVKASGLCLRPRQDGRVLRRRGARHQDGRGVPVGGYYKRCNTRCATERTAQAAAGRLPRRENKSHDELPGSLPRQPDGNTYQ